MSRYFKAIAALLGAVSTWGITAAADDAISTVEWFGLVGALGTVIAVYAVPNDPPAGQLADPALSERGFAAVEFALGAAVALVLVAVALRF